MGVSEPPWGTTTVAGPIDARAAPGPEGEGAAAPAGHTGPASSTAAPPSRSIRARSRPAPSPSGSRPTRRGSMPARSTSQAASSRDDQGGPVTATEAPGRPARGQGRQVGGHVAPTRGGGPLPAHDQVVGAVHHGGGVDRADPSRQPEGHGQVVEEQRLHQRLEVPADRAARPEQ